MVKNRGRTTWNIHELVRTLNRSIEGRKKNSPKLLNGGGARAESAPNRLMQRPSMKQRRSSTAAAELERWGVTRRTMRRTGTGEENERGPRYYL